MEPSPSQRNAIEAEPGPLLVLAGPGAGKTFCLTERIRFLIERHNVDPARICAFTFTNKAAGEIAHRLTAQLGPAAERITRGTLHAFCATLLREFGPHVRLEPGFGIADEDYQLNVLRRIEGSRPWHRNVLTRFSAHRFRGDPLQHDDLVLLDRYERYLEQRKLVDFDTMVTKAVDLLEVVDDAAATVRQRWDVVLVDEFQDLNPMQYRLVRGLACKHRHVFAVGDDEQSIYSWAGATPTVFRDFVTDFHPKKIHLEDNRRCPREVFAPARKLVTINTPLFTDRVAPHTDRTSPFPVQVLGFDTDDAEAAWIIDDIRRDRTTNGHRWGDVALLYRKHEIGERLEAAFVKAGIACRLAQGRALSDDPIVAYVIAVARVISNPNDELFRNAYFRAVLPRHVFDEAQAKADEQHKNLQDQLRWMATNLARGDERGRQVRRALANWRNLKAVTRQCPSLAALVQELLSRRIGNAPSALDEHHDEISDPATSPDVIRLATRLRSARERKVDVWLPAMSGVEVPLIGMLIDIGVNAVRGSHPPRPDAEQIGPEDSPSLGLPLAVFKAAQLLEMDGAAAPLTRFTAIDLETTDRNARIAEIVEIAAVRVRNGKIVERFTSYVKPNRPITRGAADAHGIQPEDIATAPAFAEIWPGFRAFCGDDVVVAHNGYEFDFRILRRMAHDIGSTMGFCTYDALPLARELIPTSRKLPDLAHHFGIPAGRSHRALDDTITLAQVMLALGEAKAARARKTALLDLLGHLGVALALCDETTLCPEAQIFRNLARPFALGRYSGALEWYERERGDDTTIPGVDEVIDRLGGAQLMLKIRAEKTASERYPVAMRRLRRLIADTPDIPFAAQVSLFLERVALSTWDGHEPEPNRVNLLTLHSTKGLEFSRVYVVGVEDAQMPGSGSPTTGPSRDEIEEARRLLYVGMTRTIDRLVLTRTATRGDRVTGGHQFLDEMDLPPRTPA